MTTIAPTLDQRHREHLLGSAISPAIIAARGYCTIAPGSVHDWRQVAPLIHSDSLLRRILHQGGLAFPLYRCADPQPFTWVLRPDQPRVSKEGKPIKYEYPASVGNVFDVLPRYRAALPDPAIPLWLTEGAKKADALASVYGEQIVPINENGVWGWRSKGRILEDFTRVAWEGRRVILAPDGDVRHNKLVYQAVKRSAQLLKAKGAAHVLICMLPTPPDQPTLGVDDYLARGHTISDLESHLVELDVVATQARVALCKHPDTGEKLFLPPGYDVQGPTITRTTPTGAPSALYSGLILVTRTGRNLHTGEETATVQWNGKGAHHQVEMLRAEMASAAGCTKTLGGAGAAVHAGNARALSTFLVEFIQENYDALPRCDYTERLGEVNGGLVLPGGQVGLPHQVVYNGPEIRVGTDHDAYPRVLHQAATWDRCTALWVVLALALASPALARMRPERNPVVMLAGDPSSGKTTIAHCAVGAYGDPTKAPLQVQCGSGSTTRVGIQQTLTTLNGVPVFLDDAHMLWLKKPDVVEGSIYDFANAQLRTYGGLNNRVQGGQALGGLMLMAGEMLPDFAHGGSQRRTFVIDCRRHLPVGRPRESAEGEQRARLVRSTWQQGAGCFGMAVNERIWQHWAQFVSDVQAVEQDSALRDLHAWRRLFATAAQALQVALHLAGVTLDQSHLLGAWARMYQETQKEHDPALEAFERALVMLAQCEQTDDSYFDDHTKRTIPASWRWLTYDRKMVAAQRIGESCWRVLTTSPQWRTLVGPGMVDQFGSTWLEKQLILEHKAGKKASERVYTGPGRGYQQCVLVPDRFFAEHDDPTDS